MISILRSTAVLGATLALAATALMPGQASAATETETFRASTSEFETIKHKFNYSENFVLETNDPYELADISCGSGSSSPFLPCDDVKSFCALMGGNYEPGSCTLPDWPPPPSRD